MLSVAVVPGVAPRQHPAYIGKPSLFFRPAVHDVLGQGHEIIAVVTSRLGPSSVGKLMLCQRHLLDGAAISGVHPVEDSPDDTGQFCLTLEAAPLVVHDLGADGRIGRCIKLLVAPNRRRGLGRGGLGFAGRAAGRPRGWDDQHSPRIDPVPIGAAGPAHFLGGGFDGGLVGVVDGLPLCPAAQVFRGDVPQGIPALHGVARGRRLAGGVSTGLGHSGGGRPLAVSLELDGLRTRCLVLLERDGDIHVPPVVFGVLYDVIVL